MRYLLNRVIILIIPPTLEEFLEYTVEEQITVTGLNSDDIRKTNEAIYGMFDKKLKRFGDEDDFAGTDLYVRRGFDRKLYVYRKWIN